MKPVILWFKRWAYWFQCQSMYGDVRLQELTFGCQLGLTMVVFWLLGSTLCRRWLIHNCIYDLPNLTYSDRGWKCSLIRGIFLSHSQQQPSILYIYLLMQPSVLWLGHYFIIIRFLTDSLSFLSFGNNISLPLISHLNRKYIWWNCLELEENIKALFLRSCLPL